MYKIYNRIESICEGAKSTSVWERLTTTHTKTLNYTLYRDAESTFVRGSQIFPPRRPNCISCEGLELHNMLGCQIALRDRMLKCFTYDGIELLHVWGRRITPPARTLNCIAYEGTKLLRVRGNRTVSHEKEINCLRLGKIFFLKVLF